MASRSIWKGFIRFSLVSVPVKAYTATNSATGISLNQLHKGCNARVNYKKMCPTHGELKTDDIVSGYEYSDGQYVIVNTDELEKLRTPKDRAIDIATFIPEGAIDPAYFSGKTYYLVPDGPIGFKPYTLLHRTMVDQKRYAFAQVVFSGKEQIMLLRPIGKLIAMTPLSFTTEVKNPSEFEPEVPGVEVTPDELKLARTLTDVMTSDTFDLSTYKDTYTERLQKLIESKISGQEIVASPAEESPQVINLMEALQKSVAEAKSKKPPKLAATTAEVAKAPARKRKSS